MGVAGLQVPHGVRPGLRLGRRKGGSAGFHVLVCPGPGPDAEHRDGATQTVRRTLPPDLRRPRSRAHVAHDQGLHGFSDPDCGGWGHDGPSGSPAPLCLGVSVPGPKVGGSRPTNRPEIHRMDFPVRLRGVRPSPGMASSGVGPFGDGNPGRQAKTPLRDLPPLHPVRVALLGNVLER